jgi:hypothetical protein
MRVACIVELLKPPIVGICMATDIELEPAVCVPTIGAGDVGSVTVNDAK